MQPTPEVRRTQWTSGAKGLRWISTRHWGTDTLAVLAGAVAAALIGGLAAAFDPLLVLTGAAVAAFIGLSLVRPEVPLLVLIALGPLEGATAFASEGTLSLTKVVGLLAFASFFLNAAMTRRRLVLDASQAIVLAILAIALISSLQARDVSSGLTTSLRYASFAILFLIVTQFAGQPRALRRIAWTLSAAATVAAGLGLFYYFSGAFFVATLPFANPNDYAFMLATTLPLTFWLVRSSRNPPVALIMAAVIAGATLLSFSRGALLGLAAWGAWAIVSSRRRLLTIVAAVAIVGTSFVLAVWSDPARFETGLQLKETVATQNVQTRIDAWRGALNLIGDSPVLGVGPGNFRLHFFEATGRPPGTENLFVVHNAYLDVAAELGLTAAFLFLGYVLMQLTRAARMRRERFHEPQGLAGALQGALIVAAVSALTLSEQYFAPFWLLGAMVTCMWVVRGSGQETG